MANNGWHVLVVEDLEDDMNVLVQVLNHHGIQVTVARDGTEAVALLQTQQPSVIIMDLAMPNMDGWETLVQIRSSSATAHIPVVALTAYYSAEVALQAQEAGFNLCLPKPVDPATLVSELSAVL